MSVHPATSALSGGMVGTGHGQTHATGGLADWELQDRHQHSTWDAMETYFECITTCSLEDGECVTRCVEQLRET
ncbi:MAG: hypothetical protein ACKO0M_12250 [Cyanobium sp.]